MQRSMLSLIVGIVFAVVAVGLMYGYVNSLTANNAPPAPAIPLGQIVVTSKDLPFGVPVTQQTVKLVPWPTSSIPRDAFTKIDDIFAGATKPGDRITLALIQNGQPITKSNISGFGAKPTLSRQVDNGMRAVSIRVDDVVGVAGFVLPGDRVDVLLTRRTGQGEANHITETILQNVTIMGVDQTADQAADKPIVARTATVQVSPEDAQRLTLAQQSGTITLALRGVENEADIPVRPISESDLGVKRAAAPTQRPVETRAPVIVAPQVPTVRVRYGDAPPVLKPVQP